MVAIKTRYRIPRSSFKRGVHSFALVASLLVVGTVGMHLIEGLSYIDAFYFMSMLSTAQGPPTAPVTVTGKIFASLMAFVSVGSVVAGLGYLFGPFFGMLWKIGVEHMEEESHLLRTKIRHLEEEIHLLKRKENR